MATHDDGPKTSAGYSDDGFYATSTGGAGGGAHHFDDGTQAFGKGTSPFDKDTSSFDTTGYTPVDTFGETATTHYEDEDERKPFAWSGSADLGLLVLRVALGGVFIGHGLQKVFGLFGGPGIDTFAEQLRNDFGFREAKILAWVTGVTELAGGSLLVLGLFTPLAAAGILGVMVNAIVLKYGGGPLPAGGVKGFLTTGDGIELEVAYAAMAFGLMFAGPGRAAIDYNRSWFRHPLPAGFICLVLAAGATTATLLVFR
ncbi:putative oxidoreductase [Saccharothrix tamanrassetensis]|uniref:Putative oxidoreductase n=1 Tax=Saccharothrix tamanrassetensis TaxID=1051531 RepID=A0A841CA80_9PSEU|nr:DoxX family protein [Saccharothrix tamanrassetensis]MBB5955422.1 putative oxidoreductase [Saccharothrix tamanrassetensis]